MKRRTKIGLGGLTAAVAAVGVLLAIAAEAVAWTDVSDSSTARWDSMCFYPLPDGGVRGRIDAHALKADGGVGRNEPLIQDVAGQIRTDVLNLATNRALPAWVAAQQ